jgi:hypothetical protein
MSLVNWFKGAITGLGPRDLKRLPRIEQAEELLATGDPDAALSKLPFHPPEDEELLARYLDIKLRAALRMRDLLCLEGMALHAETLGTLMREKARYLMLEAEAIGALNLAKALAQGISLSGAGAGEDLLRIKNAKAGRVNKEGYITIAHTALQDQYSDIRLVGLGRHSFVISAIPRDREYRVAVKFLGPKSYLDTKGRKRFEREVATLSRLDHPRILRVFGAQFEEPPYMITEFFAGADLAKLLDQGRSFFPGEIAKIGIALCEAVAFAHGRDIIHRNIQPANVLMNYENQIKLIDFGMARFSSSENISTMGMVLGEWAYLPPERFAGNPTPTQEQDIFGIGATLYHLATQKPPFTRGKGLMRERSPEIREAAPGLPPALHDVIHRCLYDDPQERWGSAEEILEILKE